MTGRGVEVMEEQRSGGAEEIDPSLSSAPSLLCSSTPPRLRPSASSVTIAGIPVANLTENETVAAIDELISQGGSHYAAVVNAAKIVAANRDGRLKQILLEGDLVTADGMSVVWASRILGGPLKQRVTGIDLFERLIEHAALRGLSVYFVGASEESVGGVAERFAKKYPSLKISGYHNGYFTDSESQSLVESIRLSRADLLFVAMGSPAQEYWIASNIEKAGVRFALGVGGSFDHVSGLARRAPQWMQRIGFEWLYRFLREPRRMWRRYLIGNSVFIWLIARQRLSHSRGDTTALS